MENLNNLGENDNVTQEVMLDLMIVRRMALRYSKVANLYLLAYNAQGEILCEMTGDPAENKKLLDYIGQDRLDALYTRVATDDLEVQATEDTAVSNIKIAGSSLHVDHKPIVTC